MIDWIELSRSFPEFIFTVFVVIVIVYVNRENKESSRTIMAEWRQYLIDMTERHKADLFEMNEQHKKEMLAQEKIHLDSLTNTQKLFDARIQQQEAMFLKTLLDLSEQHKLELENITNQGQLIINTLNRLDVTIKDFRKVLQKV